MEITRESKALALLCVADLVTTLWFVGAMGAQEANPLMRYYLDLGVLPFIAAKMVFFVCPLLILEWARRRHPQFVRSMLRLGIVLYVGSYSVVVWSLNRPVEGEKLTPWQIAAIERECARPVGADEVAWMRAHLRP